MIRPPDRARVSGFAPLHGHPLLKNIFAPLALFAVETLTAKRAKNAKTGSVLGPPRPGRPRMDTRSRVQYPEKGLGEKPAS